MRRTGWLASLLLALMALAPAAVAEDSSDSGMDILAGLPQCAVRGKGFQIRLELLLTLF